MKAFRMNREAFKQVVKESRENRDNINIAKSNDYADVDEVLGNFKRCSVILSTVFSGKLKDPIKKPLTADDVALIYIVLKIDRYANLTGNSKTPNNEGLKDTIQDMQNYVELMEACFVDRTAMPDDIKKLCERAKGFCEQIKELP